MYPRLRLVRNERPGDGSVLYTFPDRPGWHDGGSPDGRVIHGGGRARYGAEARFASGVVAEVERTLDAMQRKMEELEGAVDDVLRFPRSSGVDHGPFAA